MAGFHVTPFDSADADLWNATVEAGNGGTLFHRLDFLAYHGERFADCECPLGIYKGNELYGVLPLAIVEENGLRCALSPFGASYGGPVFARPQSHADSQEIVTAYVSWLKDRDIVKAEFVLPVAACYNEYCETFRLNLMDHGFALTKRRISCLVNLQRPVPLDAQFKAQVRNKIRKATKASVRIEKRGDVEDFLLVLEKTFEKHGVPPTHSKDEFRWLCEDLSQRVYVDVAYVGKQPVAGIGYFVINDLVNSSFYLCQDPSKQETAALSLLVSEALRTSQAESFSWFDFGATGRANIFTFKEGFGSIGMFRDTFTCDLSG